MNKLLDLLVERRRRQAGDDVPALLPMGNLTKPHANPEQLEPI
jgi:hypothetical protein